MPRANRRQPEPADDSFARLLSGWKRTETRRGVSYTVQPVGESQAQKTYTCPGCGRDITPRTAHLVVWRADGVLGDAADGADREMVDRALETIQITASNARDMIKEGRGESEGPVTGTVVS